MTPTHTRSGDHSSHLRALVAETARLGGNPWRERYLEAKKKRMRILKYQGKLVEEIGYTTAEKVVFLRYVRNEDKPKCECGRPIDKEISIVEGCPNWNETIKGVDTLPNH
jgi:hypothetical protein